MFYGRRETVNGHFGAEHMYCVLYLIHQRGCISSLAPLERSGVLGSNIAEHVDPLRQGTEVYILTAYRVSSLLSHARRRGSPTR